MNKICLINPPTTGPFSKDVYFPMGPVCLGSTLKENSISVEIVDFDLDLKKDPSLSEWHRFKDHAIQRLEETRIQFFGISSICSNFPIALLLAKEIRRKWPSSRIVLGGPQPSAVPEETLKTCPWIDVIAIGEGEETLLDLARSDWSKESLKKIPGIGFMDGNTYTLTARRTLIENLDDLPFPDFSLVPVNEYLAISPGTALIEAGRGCPFLCSFCSTAIMWERNFRVKTPARILEEMRRLSQEYGLKSFGLTHDNFTTSHSYVAEFCGYFAEHNVEGFKWSSSARPDTLNSERIESMYRAGCGGVFLGIDTGSPRIQKEIKKNLSIEHYRGILPQAVGFNMEVISSFILGFPAETEEDVNQTVLLALESKLKGACSVQFHRLSPLAGTDVLDGNRSNLSLNVGPTDVSLLPISDEEIEDLIARDSSLFSSFYSVATPHLGDLNVSAFAVFCDALINHEPAVLERLLKATRLVPTELFSLWFHWRKRRYLEKPVEQSFILNTFGQFMTEAISTSSPRLDPPRTVHQPAFRWLDA